MTLRRLLTLTLAVLVLPVAASGCGGYQAGTYSGQVLSGAPRAPDFTLRDASGRTVRLSDFRGRAVLLTFVYTDCPDVCPLIMTNLGVALDKAGADARKAQILAVSVDPKGDTPERVRTFLRVRGLADRAQYLIGTRKELEPVWKAYGIAVQATPEEREVGHSATVRGITAGGRQQTTYPQNFSPTAVARDVPLLAGA
jgi:protein SCO1/2